MRHHEAERGERMSAPCCKVGTEWCVISHDTSGEACRPLDDCLFDSPSGRRHIDPALLLEVANRCESDRLAAIAETRSLRAELAAATARADKAEAQLGIAVKALEYIELWHDNLTAPGIALAAIAEVKGGGT